MTKKKKSKKARPKKTVRKTTKKPVKTKKSKKKTVNQKSRKKISRKKLHKSSKSKKKSKRPSTSKTASSTRALLEREQELAKRSRSNRVITSMGRAPKLSSKRERVDSSAFSSKTKKSNKGKKGEKKEVTVKSMAGKTGVLDRYKVEIDGAEITIVIKIKNDEVTYSLDLPHFGEGTHSLIEDVKKNLLAQTNIQSAENFDAKTLEKIKKQFREKASELIRKIVPTMDVSKEKFLVGMLIQEMLGLGKLEFLINDPNLEEVVIIGSKEPVRVYHKKFKWIKSDLYIEKEEQINNYASIIARRVGRQVNILSPLLDAHVVTGDRANAVLHPISTKGNTITIRKFARDPWTIVDLIGNKTVNLDIAALMWLAMEYEMNVLVSGGTASGKTVFLNSCLIFIPPNQRILSIEDTRELMLPDFLYWNPLATRTPNPEGKGEVSMLDLLVNALRMRPDRIILGEMRRQKEAQVLFEAMHTGHSVNATLHADTAQETISRLTNPPLSIPANLLRSVNLNVVMFRHRKKGIRRVFQMAEYNVTEENVSANVLYRWSPETDDVVKHRESEVFFETLSRHTGMTISEVNRDVEFRKKVLTWMVENNIRDLKRVGKVMKIYYTNRDLLSQIMSKNLFSKLE